MNQVGQDVGKGCSLKNFLRLVTLGFGLSVIVTLTACDFSSSLHVPPHYKN